MDEILRDVVGSTLQEPSAFLNVLFDAFQNVDKKTSKNGYQQINTNPATKSKMKLLLTKLWNKKMILTFFSNHNL